jgi:hypothetical protein
MLCHIWDSYVGLKIQRTPIRWTKDPTQCQAIEILKSIMNSYAQGYWYWHTFDTHL